MPLSSPANRLVADGSGQAFVLLLGVLCAVLVGAAVLGSIARGLGAHAERQRAADLAALAAGRVLREALPRRYEPPWLGARRNPRHLTHAQLLAQLRATAEATVRRNGFRGAALTLPGDAVAPTRVRVRLDEPIRTPAGRVRAPVVAEAEVVAALGVVDGGQSGAGVYSGPFAHRQGKPMRPDVALAFDRLQAAARADGFALVITSAFRSDAEQAALFARRPDPRWVAPPGTSLHRLGTELDLGPPAAYAWLRANAPRFGFLLRYGWEPWHFGFTGSPGTVSVGFDGRGRGGIARAAATRGAGTAVGAVPAWVPGTYAMPIRRAAVRWGVGAALLAAQIKVESNFDARARSPAGALGIAQFMPATARAYGLRDPFDAGAAIDAQAHMMRDLLGRFAAVPLALAAYNAGPGRVAGCGCVPPIPETQAYVARILAILGGADPGGLAGSAGLTVRLVR